MDLSLLYEVGEHFRMHEQLLSLGEKIALEPKYGRRITCAAPSLLPDAKELQEKVQ